MKEESKFSIAREIRFYMLYLLASFLLVTGLYMEPPGEISASVSIAAGGLMTVAACVVGVDVKGIIREYRMIGNQKIESPSGDFYVEKKINEDEKA